MKKAPLTRERILAAAEEVLRRHGPAKANVVDVAQALGVSHGSVYRHFPSKAALRDAVLGQWLARIDEPLRAIATGRAAPPARLRQWLTRLWELKHARAREEPELFAAYGALVADAREGIGEHLAHMYAQLGEILAAGMQRGDFRRQDPATAARAVFAATSRYHHPAMAPVWNLPDEQQVFAQVVELLLRGLAADPAEPAGRRH